MGDACDECKRIHPGVCEPGDVSQRLCLSVPARVDRLLRDRVAWGERSSWVAALIERELTE